MLFPSFPLCSPLPSFSAAQPAAPSSGSAASLWTAGKTTMRSAQPSACSFAPTLVAHWFALSPPTFCCPDTAISTYYHCGVLFHLCHYEPISFLRFAPIVLLPSSLWLPSPPSPHPNPPFFFSPRVLFQAIIPSLQNTARF